ncbi:pyruvate ferredoxin oxidoreductase [candidate division KSB1 bacterium]|nr:MAG: pyruvate ferredoxin oxidoreductase [candidate division KSB1 bacterium]
MAKTELRITGFGGQGVILSAYIIGKAASIFDNKYATMTQSFGPEARGSACSAQLIISEEKILYPYIIKPNIMIAMSQEGYEKYEATMKGEGILIYESNLVKPGKNRTKIKKYCIPSTKIAEDLGRRIIQNIVMLGFFTAVTGLIDYNAMKEAVKTSVPRGTEELNLKAFESGYEYFKKQKK